MRNIFNLYETCCSDALLIKTKKTYEAGVTDLKRRDVGGGDKERDRGAVGCIGASHHCAPTYL